MHSVCVCIADKRPQIFFYASHFARKCKAVRGYLKKEEATARADFRQFKEGNRRFSGAESGTIPHNSREGGRDGFASDANCRFRRRTGGTSRKLQAADVVKASVSPCAILCGIVPSFPTQKWRKRRRDGVSGNFSDTPLGSPGVAACRHQ